VEAEYRKIEGVLLTEVGYTGGHLADPSYQDVCTGRTGHAEAVRIGFDPRIVTYQELLTVFWGIHDPTQLNRQGADVGVQYRSAIFALDAEQALIAKRSKERIQQYFGGGVMTVIERAKEFYRAEEFHQQYLAKRGEDACASTIQRRMRKG
jgi:peptide-methionine (S)-S-oxide reductase